MSAEVWTILSVGIALGGLVIGLGGFMWWMLQSFRREVDRRFEQVDKRFEQVAECFREMRRQIARLAEDHHTLAREFYELRGEIRGRLDERSGPASAG
jgi:hypothetical protein